MRQDGVGAQVVAAPGTTETSPLLGDEAVAVSYDGTAGEPEDARAAGAADSGPDGDDAESVTRDGIPEMAAKMHILIPAIGIGVC